jgi:hypothetical protein
MDSDVLRISATACAQTLCGICFKTARRHLIILTIILTSCDYINTDKRRIDKAESYKQYFYENKEVFEQLIKDIQIDKSITSKMGLFQDVDKLEDELKIKKLRRLEIQTISITQTNCEQPEIEFITSWTEYPIGQMYLTKDCPGEKSTKGSYWKGGFIEVWGLGNGWVIWIDSDPI